MWHYRDLYTFQFQNEQNIYTFENASSYKQPYHLISGILIVHDVMWKRLYFFFIYFHFYLVRACVCVWAWVFHLSKACLFSCIIVLCRSVVVCTKRQSDSTRINKNSAKPLEIVQYFFFISGICRLSPSPSFSPHFFLVCLFKLQ